NTFPLPNIIYNKSLIFSLYTFLFRILFYNRTFTAYNLISKEELSKLYILLKYN
ncbi:hypothetical protein CC78DRAFT_476307, partial [Lojkania enalia]